MPAATVTVAITAVIMLAIVSVIGYRIFKQREERQPDVPRLPIDYLQEIVEAEARIRATKSWYRVMIDPGPDAGGSGVLAVMEGHMLVTEHAQPGEALFVDYASDAPSVYFSPAAACASAALVSSLGGSPCKAPSRAVVDFLTGDPKVERSLSR